ncbi:DNA-binding response regulator [Paenibacillus chitinolyticus]|uniref:DNA-binding response regulator n=1 Tax=Paenibacillus chitinolyticus TaxID=79263 RepID=A0A410X461_9BACL|nr:response regulator transcription factor [Paenibacillus chitinolyticus]MCY9592236.1 response regulator transcription factor [Paenibacillus chitinolyticus]MCY9598069.1 response regulator transcription factor [Paenibacillus chitinolyticus]QAV21404.1 DNA-binding response regulator [Paenibacillus chitinolyticus]
MYRVFLVDDEPFIIEGLYDIIDWSSFGLEIVGQAENGREALEALKKTPVDLLITDISMPVMNGLDLIRGAREFHPDLKVVVLSGFNDFVYLKECIRLGIENYLLKPINLDELKATLDNTVEKLNASKSERLFNEYGVQILKDNMMHRWLTEQIASGEYRERADLLGIEMDKPFMAAAVMRLEENFVQVFELISRQMKYNESIIPFRDVDGDLVILFVMDDPEEGKREMIGTIEELLDRLTTYQPIRTSIGSVQPLPDQAPLSYRHAKKAQEYFLLYPEHGLIDYSDLPSGKDAGKATFPIDWSEYTKLIMAKDREKLLLRIEEDFEEMQTLEGVTPGDIQDIAMEVIILFKMALKEIKHVEETELYKEGFEKVRQAGTLRELIKAVQDVAGLTVDSLIRDIKSPVVQQVLNYIDESYAEELSLKALGALYNIHPVYLGQLFHRETGETFTEYINKYRIEKAKEQLKTTHLKVHEIARNVGYWETGYFYKQFKKYVGISPTDFKGLL